MKSILHTITLSTLFLLGIAQLAQARTEAIWIGGTPGQETNWHCHKNWSTQRVPDKYTDVVIPDVSTSTFHFPRINAGVVEVRSIRFHSRAVLTLLQSATLTVHQADKRCFSPGNFRGKGEFQVLHLLGDDPASRANVADTSLYITVPADTQQMLLVQTCAVRRESTCTGFHA